MARETINGISVPIPGTGEPADFVGDLRSFASDLSEVFTTPTEQRADIQYGRVPALATMPPTVTVTNNLADLGGTAIPGGKASNAPGFYCTVAPTDTDKLRTLGARAEDVPGTTFPLGFAVSFTNVTGQFGAFGSPTIETVLTGRYVEFIVRQFAGTVYRVLINGQYLTRRAQALGGTGNGFASILIDFGDAAVPRTVALECNVSHFWGINLAATGSPSIAKVAGPTPPRLLIAGDSYTGSAGELTSVETYPRTLGWLLGYRDVVNSGVGATGWLAPGSGSAVKFRDRITNDVVNMAPTKLILAFGHNDTSYSNSAITTEVNTTLTALRAALPTVPIAVVGPFFVGTNPGVYEAMQTAIFAGATGVSNVSLIDTVTTPIFTDTNRSKYIQGDNVHPNRAGADFMAYPLAAALSLAGFNAA